MPKRTAKRTGDNRPQLTKTQILMLEDGFSMMLERGRNAEMVQELRMLVFDQFSPYVKQEGK